MSATSLKGFYRGYYDTEFSKAVEANLMSFFDWGFIDQGAFTNVTIPTSGAYGGDFSTLRNVNDPRYTDGTVYEAIRGNWVWESGLSVQTPVTISGVWVDDVLTTSGFNVDYENGRIIFDSAQSGTIQAEYSYKEIQFLPARSNPLFQQIQYRSRRPDDSDWSITSGIYVLPSDRRLNLPCVSVQAMGRSSRPYQIGQGQWVEHTIKFYVLGEDDFSVSKISDVICNQSEKTIFMYDIDRIFESGAAPLNHLGYKQEDARSYPQLIAITGTGGFRFTSRVQEGKLRMYDMMAEDGQWIHQNLYLNVVTGKSAIIVLDI